MSFFRPRASTKPGPRDWEKCRDWLGEVTQFSSRSVKKVSTERELYSYLKVSEVREGKVWCRVVMQDGTELCRLVGLLTRGKVPEEIIYRTNNIRSVL